MDAESTLADRTKRSTGAVPRMMEIWESEYEPEVEALCRALQSVDATSMSVTVDGSEGIVRLET